MYHFFLYCNLCTRVPIFNLKTFSNFKISKSVKYGVGLSLLFAKKMQRIQLSVDTYIHLFGKAG